MLTAARNHAVLMGLAFVFATTPGQAQDAVRGERIYGRCAACHSLDRNRTGPRHCGLFGRAAGTEPGFSYSPAMRGSGIVWDAASLDTFLADPRGTVPQTRMTVAGIDDPGERADLIAFLKAAPACG